VTFKYSGDALFLPGQNTATLTVQPSIGPIYTCRIVGSAANRFNANLVALGNLPGTAPAGAVPVDHLSVALFYGRGVNTQSLATDVLETGPNPAEPDGVTGVQRVTFGFEPGGTGTATHVDRTGTQMNNADPANPDAIIGFLGETGAPVIEGAPGEVAPVELASVTIETIDSFELPSTITCTPRDEATVLGRVTIAGTTLVVDAPRPTRGGDPVTLTATTAPDDGYVEFLDGDTTIGFVAVEGGAASLVTTDLAAGEHQLRARHVGGLLAASTSSETVPLTALPEHECPGFVAEGSGAVVRLVYLELLGRCPDQAGFDHWLARLEGGTSQQAFADVISASAEARRVVANDAYRTMLGRDGDPAGLAFWAERLRTGRYDELLTAIGDTEEYWSQAGSTNEGFVTRTYQRVLQRDPDAAGLAYWTSRLDGGEARFVLLRTFTRLVEPARVIVVQSYDEILDRAPTATEIENQVERFRADGNRSALYGRLIGTAEFVTRAQRLPNPED